jgi:hypothetical protein
MYIPGQGSRSNSVEQFDLQLQPGQALLQIVLVITAPSSTNTYLGSLGLRENSGLWSLQKLALHRSAPQKQATLVVDQPTLNVPVTSPLFATRHVSTPDVSVTIHDETKTWPLEGISISPRVISSPAREALNFDKNVIVTLNGVLVSNLTQSPSDPSERAQRSIQAGGQAVLGLAFVGLNPGEYTIELKLLALNSKDDDKQQKLTINVKVSHSIWPAAGILVIALLLSFVTYKLLRVYQQSLGFQSRLAALNPPWLKELPPYYSVVWARIAVEETGHLVRRLLFINPASVNERIDRVPPVLEALNEARHARIAMRQLRQLVINRFDSVVSGHIRSMSDRDMNKDAAQKARDALSALNADIDAGRINDSYWAEVQKEVTSFFSEFSDQDVDSFRTSLNNTGMTSGGKTDVDTILSTRKAPSKPTNLIDMMEYEKNYMKVKFLFERREWKEFPGLINVF